MLDKIETWANRLPGIVETRWLNHWPPVAIGGVLILLALAAVIGGTIWAGAGIDRSERAMEFWITTVVYVAAGGALILYV
jgi:hypothetical protein